MNRVQPEGGLKNWNQKLDFPKPNSVFFYIPGSVNLEPEFQFLVPVPAKPELEIGLHLIPGRNLLDFIFPKYYLILKLLNVQYWRKNVKFWLYPVMVLEYNIISYIIHHIWFL